jgi:hypothetical protein
MFDAISTIFNQVAGIFQDIYNGVKSFEKAIIDLTKDVNNLANGTDSNIDLYLGHFRYVVGDKIYLFYYAVAMMGCLYTLYVLVKGIISLISQAKLSAFKKVPLSM